MLRMNNSIVSDKDAAGGILRYELFVHVVSSEKPAL